MTSFSNYPWQVTCRDTNYQLWISRHASVHIVKSAYYNTNKEYMVTIEDSGNYITRFWTADQIKDKYGITV